MRAWITIGGTLLLAVAAPATGATLRDDLAQSAFVTTEKAVVAIAQVNEAIRVADGLLAAAPLDREARLQRGVALGYRAKLTRSRSDAVATRRIFEQLVQSNPRDAEAQMAIAAWHLDAYDQLGGFLAKTGLGARWQDGAAALDRAVALGGNRAFFPGLAALMRIRLDPGEVAAARQLAEAAGRAQATTPLDRLMKRDAALILPALQAGDGKGAAALARKLLPFGRLGK